MEYIKKVMSKLFRLEEMLHYFLLLIYKDHTLCSEETMKENQEYAVKSYSRRNW